MASVPAAVAAPPAAPAAAPASPAPAAPASPVTTEAQPSTPVVDTPTAQPGDTPAPVTETPTAALGGKPEPKREDYGEEDVEKFLQDHNAWEAEQEGGETPAAEPGAEPTAEAPKPEAEPADLPEDDAPATPEAIASFEAANPAFKEALAADPKLKGQLYKMAREYAKAQPIAQHFTSEKAAKFARETADRVVTMRSAFQLAAEDPSKIGDAFSMFTDEFKVTDAQGKPVLNPDGSPKMAEDYDVLVNHMLDGYFDGEMSQVEAKLKANQFASEAERENYEAFAQAVKFIKSFKNADPSEFSRPDLSGLTDEQRQHFEERESRLNKREEELGLKKGAQAKADRIQARQQYITAAKQDLGSEAGKRIADAVKEKIASGVYVPSYVLETKDPTTGVSVFALNVYNQFAKMLDDPDIKAELSAFQFRAPTAENLNEYKQFQRAKLDEFLQPIIDKEIRKIQGKERAARQAKSGKTEAARSQVEPEPRGGAAPRPRLLSDEEAYAQALKTVRDRGVDSDKEMEMALIEKEKILAR